MSALVYVTTTSALKPSLGQESTDAAFERRHADSFEAEVDDISLTPLTLATNLHLVRGSLRTALKTFLLSIPLTDAFLGAYSALFLIFSISLLGTLVGRVSFIPPALALILAFSFGGMSFMVYEIRRVANER